MLSTRSSDKLETTKTQNTSSVGTDTHLLTTGQTCPFLYPRLFHFPSQSRSENEMTIISGIRSKINNNVTADILQTYVPDITELFHQQRVGVITLPTANDCPQKF